MEHERRPRKRILGAAALGAVVALVAGVSAAGADSGPGGASAGTTRPTLPVQQGESAPDDPRGREDCPERDGSRSGNGSGSESQDATPAPTSEV